MKFFQNLVWVAIFSLSGTVAAQTPVYLDETKPMEDRIEDALSRMTLEEKSGIVPRTIQIQFTGSASFGIARKLDDPTVLMEFVPRSFGTNGTKQGGRTILVWHSRH